jgi:hypothetical protein
MKHIKRLGEWFYNHTDSIMIIFTIIAGVVGGAFVFFDNKAFNNEAYNTTLLIIIATNLLLIAHRYLKNLDTRTKNIETESRKIDDVLKNLEVENIRADAVDNFIFGWDWQETLVNAEHDVFVSSAALYNMVSGSKHIIHWTKDASHKLRLVSLKNTMYGKYLEVYHTKCQAAEEGFDLQKYKDMSNQAFNKMFMLDNVCEKEIDKIMPCAFIAVDCGIDTPSFNVKPHSHIIAFFYLPNKLAKDLVMKVVATSGTALFEEFKLEIESIWKDAK